MSRKKEYRQAAKAKRNVLDFVQGKKRRQTTRNGKVFCDPRMPDNWNPDSPNAA